jgi:hypothetical protein
MMREKWQDTADGNPFAEDSRDTADKGYWFLTYFYETKLITC